MSLCSQISAVRSLIQIWLLRFPQHGMSVELGETTIIRPAYRSCICRATTNICSPYPLIDGHIPGVLRISSRVWFHDTNTMYQCSYRFMLVDVLSGPFCGPVSIGDTCILGISHVIVWPKQCSADTTNSAISISDSNALGWAFHDGVSISHGVCCWDNGVLTCTFSQ